MALPEWGNYVIGAGLLVCSALFSGLTLGLLSLDLSSLTILAEAGDFKERLYAKQIIPLRRHGNLLLCTLLIGNVIANSFLSILLASITTGLAGGLASTVLIVLFGEIGPQATCSRHGLYIGAKTRYITWGCVILFYIVAWPISKVLDFLLGREVGMMYSRDELKHLLKMQVVEGKKNSDEDGIDADDHNLLAGALEYSDRVVSDVMTPIEKVYMLEAARKLDFETMLEIYKSGFTRIPVYEGGSRDRVSNMLFVKDLILVDPDDEIEVQTVVSFRGPSHVRLISDQTPLDEVFKIFKASYSHLMIAIQFLDPVTSKPLHQEQILERIQAGDTAALSLREVTGVITLEDILEEVIRAEIVDEHDTFIANDSLQRVHKERGRPDMAAFLSLFEHKVRENAKLNRQEVHAITAFLVGRVPEFAVFDGAQSQLRQLIAHSTVLDEDDNSATIGDEDEWSVDSADLFNRLRDVPGERVGSHAILYRRGVDTDFFTLVLQGRALVWAGSEAFQSELGPWQSMGSRALVGQEYRPDFTACTTSPCRLMQIKRSAFQQAAATVMKAREARTLRFSGSLRRESKNMTWRPPHVPAPAATGAVSVNFRKGVPPTPPPAPLPKTAGAHLAIEGPHGVSAAAAEAVREVDEQGGAVRSDGGPLVALPGSIAPSASNGARAVSCGNSSTALPAAAPLSAQRSTAAEGLCGDDGGTPSSSKATGMSKGAGDSGVLRGVVVLGDRGQPMYIDEEDGAGEAVSGPPSVSADNGSRSLRSSRYSTEALELALVKSKDGAASALFRAVTPAESSRRKQPGWRESDEAQHAMVSPAHSESME